MTDILRRQATDDDILYVAKHLRKCDRKEIKAATGRDHLEVILQSRAVSLWTDAVLINGEPVAIMGVAPMDDERSRGIPWCVGTRVMDKYPKQVLKVGRQVVNEMYMAFPILVNYVDQRNKKAINLLNHLGFLLVEVDAEFGAAKIPFIRFIGIRDV